MRFLFLVLTFFVYFFATPVRADVAPAVYPTEFIDEPIAGLLIAANLVATVVNTAQIVGDGSYWLGALGIAVGATALAVEASYGVDERSAVVDITSILSVSTGVFSILRRVQSSDKPSVSLQPAFSSGWYGASLRIRF